MSQRSFGRVLRESARRLGMAGLCSLVAGPVLPQATDLVDASQLGGRGVVLTLPAANFGIEDARGIGDFDGDGFDDIAILGRDPVSSEQPLIVIHGRSALSGQHALDLHAAFPGSLVLQGYLENTVQGGGDLNGDGYAEILSGAPLFRSRVADMPGRGFGFALEGGPRLEGEGFVEEVGDTLPGVLFVSSDPGDSHIGSSVVNVGDVNGDGAPDLAVSAPVSSPLGRTTTGAVFVVFGAAALPERVDLATVGQATPGLAIYGASEREEISGEVRPSRLVVGNFLGDFNGDGYAEILLTAVELYPEKIYLVRGGADLPPVLDLADVTQLEQHVTVLSGLPLLAAASQSAGVGDLDGDGAAELLVGNTNGDSEAVYLFHGGPGFPARVDLQELAAGLATKITPLADTEKFFEGFGTAVAPAGDLNGDAVPDFLIGARDISVRGQARAGEAYAVFGWRDRPVKVSLAAGFAGIRMLGEGAGDAFGSTVASAGDFNADGALDLVVGAYQTRSQVTGSPPKVYVIYGSGSDAPPFLLHAAEPAFGSVRGGTTVTLRGSGFRGQPRVTFGDRSATHVNLVSPVELRVTTPAGTAPGIVPLAVTVDGIERTLPGGYEYTPPLPRIDLADLGSQGLRLAGEDDADFDEVALDDVTGDGIDDVLLSSSVNGRWVLSIIHGDTTLPESLSPLTPGTGVTVVTSSEDRNGTTVGGVGDVDGDGFRDYVIGIEGAAGFLCFGRGDLPPSLSIEDEIVALRAVPLERGAFRGMFNAVPLDDVNGDDIADFGIAFAGPAAASQDPEPGPGEILLLAGRTEWPEIIDLSATGTRFWRIHGVLEHQAFARSLVPVGDVNGDGLGDLLASTEFVPGRLLPPFDGMAYLLFGTREPPVEISIEEYVDAGGAMVIGFELGGLPWYDLAAAGDVNRDGFADFLIGAEGGGSLYEGITYLVHGRPDLAAGNPLKLLERPDAPDGVVRILGPTSHAQAVGGGPAGDFNADGFDDFLVPAQPDPHAAPPTPGNLFVVFGDASLDERIDLRRLGSRGLSLPCPPISVLHARPWQTGDVNGDGHRDFCFSQSPEIDFRDPIFRGRPGNVYVIYGLGSESAFVRGDANADADVNISDAIFTLSFLFLGGPGPLCDDAADADDNGTLEITDAVRVLNSLFLGNATLPQPFPEAGEDPTADLLRCRGF